MNLAQSSISESVKEGGQDKDGGADVRKEQKSGNINEKEKC